MEFTLSDHANIAIRGDREPGTDHVFENRGQTTF